MLCPACKIPLLLSERQGIEIDYCSQCRGVWLDRGELDKIIARNQQEERPAPDRPPASRPDAYAARRGHGQAYDYDERRHDPHYRRRKKSFLADLLDFD